MPSFLDPAVASTYPKARIANKMRPNSSRPFSLTQYAIIAPITAPNTEASLSSASYMAPAIELKREGSTMNKRAEKVAREGVAQRPFPPKLKSSDKDHHSSYPRHIYQIVQICCSPFSPLFPSSVTWPRNPRCAASLDYEVMKRMSRH